MPFSDSDGNFLERAGYATVFQEVTPTGFVSCLFSVEAVSPSVRVMPSLLGVAGRSVPRQIFATYGGGELCILPRGRERYRVG